jgi:hypothetical protein
MPRTVIIQVRNPACLLENRDVILDQRCEGGEHGEAQDG